MKNGEFKIEKNVPIPGIRGKGKNAGATAVLRAMKKGESVLLECSTQSATGLYLQIGGKGKFTVRKVDNSHVRVWKIA